MEDTINLLKNLSAEGYVILLENKPWFKVEKYDESMFLKSAGLKFELASGPNLADIKFYRLNIVPR